MEIISPASGAVSRAPRRCKHAEDLYEQRGLDATFVGIQDIAIPFVVASDVACQHRELDALWRQRYRSNCRNRHRSAATAAAITYARAFSSVRGHLKRVCRGPAIEKALVALSKSRGRSNERGSCMRLLRIASDTAVASFAHRSDKSQPQSGVQTPRRSSHVARMPRFCRHFDKSSLTTNLFFCH